MKCAREKKALRKTLFHSISDCSNIVVSDLERYLDLICGIYALQPTGSFVKSFYFVVLVCQTFCCFFKHAVCACDRGDFTVSLLQQVMLHLLGDSDGTLCAGMNKRDTKRWLNDEFWMHIYGHHHATHHSFPFAWMQDAAQEAFVLFNLCSSARKYWRKVVDRGTKGEACVLYMRANI